MVCFESGQEISRKNPVQQKPLKNLKGSHGKKIQRLLSWMQVLFLMVKKYYLNTRYCPQKKNHRQPNVGNKNFMPHKIVFENLNIVFFFTFNIFNYFKCNIYFFGRASLNNTFGDYYYYFYYWEMQWPCGQCARLQIDAGFEPWSGTLGCVRVGQDT